MAQGTSLTTSLPTAISSAYLALACLLFGATLAVYRNPWVKDHTQGTAVTRDTAVTTPDSYLLRQKGIPLLAFNSISTSAVPTCISPGQTSPSQHGPQ